MPTYQKKKKIYSYWTIEMKATNDSWNIVLEVTDCNLIYFEV